MVHWLFVRLSVSDIPDCDPDGCLLYVGGESIYGHSFKVSIFLGK